MSDVFIVYYFFSYLFTGGCILGLALDKEPGYKPYLGAMIFFLLSPILNPITLGFIFYQRCKG